MSTPVSLKERSFFSLPAPKYSGLLKDDYQKKLETLVFKGATTNGASVNYKSTTEYKCVEKKEKDEKGEVRVEKKDNFILGDELKVGFPYRGYFTQFRINRKGQIRLHFDLGNHKVGIEQNLFSQVKFTDKFDSIWLRLGTNYYSKNCQSHHRLERNFKGEYQFSYKNICRYPSFVFGFATCLGLQNLKFNKYNAFFTYTHNQFEVALQHDSPKEGVEAEKAALEAQQIGRLTAGVHYKHNDSTSLALQVRRVFSKAKPVTVNVGIQHALNKDINLKLKTNQDLKVSAALKYKLDKTVSLTASATLPLKKEGGPISSNQLVPIPCGYQVEFNI